MTSQVLRIRLVGGDHTDVEYDGEGDADENDIIDHVVATLSQEHGVLWCRHGDRTVVVFSRGVSTVEFGPRGAVL